MTLDELHLVIQVAMGWENAHLYAFRKGTESYETNWEGQPSGPLDCRRLRLADLGLKVRSKLEYEYDFGDSWMHVIKVEKVEALGPSLLPVCLAGENACPLEDCGGSDGYCELVIALHDPGHPDHEHYKEWVDEPFDPFAFDLEEVNRTLTAMFTSKKSRKSKP